MMNLKCLFTHKWLPWDFVKTTKTRSGITLDVLVRSCERCGKEGKYTGLTSKDIISGEKIPYEYMD